MRNELKCRLLKVFRTTFSTSLNDEEISNSMQGTIQEWDSLGNYMFLLEVEKEFNIRLSSRQLVEINSFNGVLEFLAPEETTNL